MTPAEIQEHLNTINGFKTRIRGARERFEACCTELQESVERRESAAEERARIYREYQFAASVLAEHGIKEAD